MPVARSAFQTLGFYQLAVELERTHYTNIDMPSEVVTRLQQHERMLQSAFRAAIRIPAGSSLATTIALGTTLHVDMTLPGASFLVSTFSILVGQLIGAEIMDATEEAVTALFDMLSTLFAQWYSGQVTAAINIAFNDVGEQGGVVTPQIQRALDGLYASMDSRFKVTFDHWPADIGSIMGFVVSHAFNSAGGLSSLLPAYMNLTTASYCADMLMSGLGLTVGAVADFVIFRPGR